MKICKQCKEPFTPTRKTQIFCSYKCCLKYHNERIHKCLDCGKNWIREKRKFCAKCREELVDAAQNTKE